MTINKGVKIGVQLFENQAKEFNRLLQGHRWMALGPWWQRELKQAGCQIDKNFEFVGIKCRQPVTNKLNSNIKGSLFLLKYLGILESQRAGWLVCPKKAKEILGEEIAGDFIETMKEAISDPPLSVLKNLALQIQDEEGFVVVSRLARTWAMKNGINPDKAEESFDQFLREQTYEGTVRIIARHQGQPRHGRGLFGDERARK